MSKLIAFFTTLAFTATAFAQAVPEDPSDLAGAIAAAYKTGNWHLFVSAIIMGLVYVVTKFPLIADRITGKAKVWLVAVTGVLSSVAVTAFTTNGDWGQAVLSGLTVGLGATGLFELLRRTVSKEKIVDANNDGILDA